MSLSPDSLRYKVGGDGGNALKVLTAYTKNLSQKPDEDKFRTIKMDNKAYSGKVGRGEGGGPGGSEIAPS